MSLYVTTPVVAFMVPCKTLTKVTGVIRVESRTILEVITDKPSPTTRPVTVFSPVWIMTKESRISLRSRAIWGSGVGVGIAVGVGFGVGVDVGA